MIDNKIQPFRELQGCPKCGMGDAPLISTAPIPGNWDPNGGPYPVQNFPVSFTPIHTRYCPGGQEPESPVELDSMASTLESMKSMLGSMIPESKRVQIEAPRGKINICAGNMQEHLHAVCSNCQYEFLMSTKDSELCGTGTPAGVSSGPFAAKNGTNQVSTLGEFEP